jgi:hypothetical protein
MAVQSDGLTLVNATTREPLEVGQLVADFRGGVWTLTGGRAPGHDGSTGRVWLNDGSRAGEFFPGVIGAEWV